MGSWADEEGLAYPLGQSWVEETQSYNFALYSKHAEAVTLLLFNREDLNTPCYTHDLDYRWHKTGRIWHARVPRAECNGAEYFAYRISGPGRSTGFEQHAFDPEKLVVDPYARCVFYPPGYDRYAAIGPGDNMGKAPLAVLLAPADVETPSRRCCVRHEADLVIYEMHVRGFTQNMNSGVPEAKRGTFAGVVDKIPYLQDLGVTAVELMPIFQFDPQEKNYWGYMPLFFFSPHEQYARSQGCARSRDEFRAMVDALHEAKLEVILDVVYSHSGEGNEEGPKFNLKLIDNSTYYLVDPKTSSYIDRSGTGNSLHCANATVRRLIVDSMTYWVKEMGVDGFRFDLASVLALNDDGTLNTGDPPIFGDIAGDPALQGVRLIAEPWDISAYELGRAFRGITWSQWNGKYRDTIQQFVRGDGGQVGEIASRIYGSADLFPDDITDTYHPYQSVNYIVSHDGFTLYDLVSYNKKHNEANGHNNEDGSTSYNWNCGWEGDKNVPDEVVRLRRRQIKNFLCLLFVSNGTPMIRMGDEFAQTQYGNNNPYNQDNETAWLDWERLKNNADLYRFTRKMIAFRKAHPSLCRSRFWRDDIRWYGVGSDPDWSESSRTLAFCVHGASQHDDDIYVMINVFPHALDFDIQETGPWLLAIDTAKPSPYDVPGEADYEEVAGSGYTVQGRAVVVLLKRR